MPDDQDINTSQLAVDRTLLAHERTLMAWVRTAASMITFGFAIYKFFRFEQNGEHHSLGLFSPREFAILLASIGLTSLFIATLSNRRDTKVLRTHLPNRRYSLAEVVALLISVFGLVVVISAILGD